jgi:hypothetical protein
MTSRIIRILAALRIPYPEELVKPHPLVNLVLALLLLWSLYRIDRRTEGKGDPELFLLGILGVLFTKYWMAIITTIIWYPDFPSAFPTGLLILVSLVVPELAASPSLEQFFRDMHLIPNPSPESLKYPEPYPYPTPETNTNPLWQPIPEPKPSPGPSASSKLRSSW